MTDPAPVHHCIDGPPNAPAVVLVGSLGTPLELWDAQAEALTERRFRVIRYDQRGHGRSPVPDGPYAIEDLGADLLALLDEVGVERAAVCGVSLGGMVAMWVASEVPARVERLALCSTSAYLGPPETWDERATAVRRDGTAPLVDATLARWLTPKFRDAHPDVVERLGEMLRATPREGYAACCEAIRDMDLRDRLGAIEAATLVIAGANDPSTTVDHARRLVEAIPDARLAVLEPGAHMLCVERADELTRALVEHLER